MTRPYSACQSEGDASDAQAQGAGQGTPEPTLAQRIGALLFAAGEPVALCALAKVTGCSMQELQQALPALEERLRACGLVLLRHAETIQMVTDPLLAPDIQKYLAAEREFTLSQPALETLAIVAYRQPITRTEIEQVRGVSCESTLRTLLRLGLIEEVGRLEQPGRPALYGTTALFLRVFGLPSLRELPPLAP